MPGTIAGALAAAAVVFLISRSIPMTPLGIAFVAAAGANALGIGINTLFSDNGTQVSTLSAPGLPSPGGGGS